MNHPGIQTASATRRKLKRNTRRYASSVRRQRQTTRDEHAAVFKKWEKEYRLGFAIGPDTPYEVPA